MEKVFKKGDVVLVLIGIKTVKARIVGIDEEDSRPYLVQTISNKSYITWVREREIVELYNEEIEVTWDE